MFKRTPLGEKEGEAKRKRGSSHVDEGGHVQSYRRLSVTLETSGYSIICTADYILYRQTQ